MQIAKYKLADSELPPEDGDKIFLESSPTHYALVMEVQLSADMFDENDREVVIWYVPS